MDPKEYSQQSIEVSFHGQAYVVGLSSGSGELKIEFEQADNYALWKGVFSAQHIEGLTSKAGSFKKLPTFVKMLTAALQQESKCSFVDLMTPADLEALRAKRPIEAARPGISLPQNKRYLILTYVGEYDRVHYPLPLTAEECPEPARLQRIIERLRSQLAAQQASGTKETGEQQVARPVATVDSSAAECAELRRENAALRERLVRVDRLSVPSPALEDPLTASATMQELQQVQGECDRWKQRCQAAEEDGERRSALYRREARQRAQETTAALQEVAAAKTRVLEMELKCQSLERDCSKLRHMRESPWQSDTEIRKGARHHAKPTPSYSRSAGASPCRHRAVPYQGSDPGARSLRACTSQGKPPRFDPTAFVRQRQERRRSTESWRSAGSSPASTPHSSLPQSGQASPRKAVSKSASLDRLRAATVASRMRAGIAHERVDRSSPSNRSSTRPSTPGRPGSFNGTRQNRTMHGPVASKQPPSKSRAASPSRALEDVRVKLNQFAARGNREASPTELQGRMRQNLHDAGSQRSSFEADVYRTRTVPASPVRDQGVELTFGARFEKELERSNLSSRWQSPKKGGARWRNSDKENAREQFGEDDADKRGLTAVSENISDIDNRLQSLQAFLRAAREKSNIFND